MSMLSEQINELREASDAYSGEGFYEFSNLVRKAADTIEALSEKLQAENMENGGGWIFCKNRTPDKEGLYIIHVITGTGEDYVGTLLYQRGVHLSGKQTYIDEKQGYWASPHSGDPVNEYLTQNVIAWQPMPKPYHP